MHPIHIEVLDTAIQEPAGREMTKLEQFVSNWKHRLLRFRRKYIPVLLWYGEEVDVGVTIKDWGALGGEPGRVWDAQQCFRDMGISFDTGSGCDGRDWEWDYSLSGPISVRIRGRAKRPWKRVHQPNPAHKQQQLKVVT